MACITAAYVRTKDFVGVLTDPPVTDTILTGCIAEVERLRWQLVQDFGCTPQNSNVVPDLIAYEVAHKIWLMFMAVGPNPNIYNPPQMGPIVSASFSRAGTSGSKTRGIGAFTPGGLVNDEYWAQTPYGQRWMQLWKSLPPEMTTSEGYNPSSSAKCCPSGGVVGFP